MFNFDQIIDRQKSDSVKWRLYDPDVLPLWVADMDFLSPPAVIDALQQRVAHGVFGYELYPENLCEIISEWLWDKYQWRVSPKSILLLQGVVTGFNLACRAFAAAGDHVLMQTPVYPPILHAPQNHDLLRNEMELIRQPDGQYAIDFDRFEQTINQRTRLFILCNPQNPTGRVFRRDELLQMAETCLRRNVIICSDEIHCDLVYSGNRHIPIASLDPAISARTITLMAPSKTFNIAGLGCSFAIIEDPELRQQFQASRKDLINAGNLLGFVAARAAYQDGRPWLDELLQYLESNRDYLFNFIGRQLPEIKMTKPEGTYLAWLDCRQLNLDTTPQQFFLEKARVALNNGADFGNGGDGFVRLNFGCPRSILQDALKRMEAALKS
jgi:cystathionine beta-lyase